MRGQSAHTQDMCTFHPSLARREGDAPTTFIPSLALLPSWKLARQWITTDWVAEFRFFSPSIASFPPFLPQQLASLPPFFCNPSISATKLRFLSLYHRHLKNTSYQSI